MIIFNTTFLVPDNIFDQWKLWISEDYIPYMLRTGSFSEPQLALHPQRKHRSRKGLFGTIPNRRCARVANLARSF